MCEDAMLCQSRKQYGIIAEHTAPVTKQVTSAPPLIKCVPLNKVFETSLWVR